MAEQFWVPLPYCSLPGCPFPIKSLGLPAHVSPQTIHFRVLDKSPVLGPRKGPPSYNTYTTQLGPRVQISQGCSQGVDHNNPQLGKKLLPGSHSCWQNSIPCELLDWGPPFCAGCGPKSTHCFLPHGSLQCTAHNRAAAAAAESLQSCPTLCDPIDSSPPGSPVPGILQARTLEWVAISFSNSWKWKVKSESEFAQSCPTLSDPMDCSPPGSSIHGIFQARVLE